MGKITGGALKRAADMESAIKRWKSDPEDDELTEQVEACVDMAMDGHVTPLQASKQVYTTTVF